MVIVASLAMEKEHEEAAYKLPLKAGEIYCGTEAHKGELGFYIVSTGGGKPYRLKIRAPSFIHMGAFDYMTRGYMIADAITLFGSYDIVMGECDR